MTTSQRAESLYCCAQAADSKKQWLDDAALELVTLNCSLFWGDVSSWSAVELLATGHSPLPPRLESNKESQWCVGVTLVALQLEFQNIPAPINDHDSIRDHLLLLPPVLPEISSSCHWSRNSWNVSFITALCFTCWPRQSAIFVIGTVPISHVTLSSLLVYMRNPFSHSVSQYGSARSLSLIATHSAKSSVSAVK